MPYGISEWANVLPNQWRLEAPPLMAFYGHCLNGWDVPMHFALGRGGRLHQLPQVDVAGERARHALPVPRAGPGHPPRRHPEGGRWSSRAICSEAKVFSAQPLKDVAVKIDISGPLEMSKPSRASTPAAWPPSTPRPWARPACSSARRSDDFSIDMSPYLDMQKKEIRSVTGELYWNYASRLHHRQHAAHQAAVGFLAGVPVKLADCRIETTNRIASVLVACWDGKPLAESKHILITAVGRCRGTRTWPTAGAGSGS